MKKSYFWVVTEDSLAEEINLKNGLIPKFPFDDFGFDITEHGDILIFKKDHRTDDTWNLMSYARGNWKKICFDNVDIKKE
jgi:hypothetical protein